MTEIPESHPRYESLVIRERLVQGVRDGLVAPEGLLAHGRGEAFDYLLGETTIPPAQRAERVAAAALTMADRPVISVNGNTAVLAPEAVVRLADTVDARIEVNLFHRTEERIAKLVAHLEDHGATGVLGADADAEIPGLDHARALCAEEGIHDADWVVVPLEDGDRAEALREMGKGLVVVDLNPLSRSARAAQVPVVDNLVRAIPQIADWATDLADNTRGQLQTIVDKFDADANRQACLDLIADRLRSGDLAAFDGHQGGAQSND